MGINKKSKRQAQQSRRKKSEYGLQLNEKQRLSSYTDFRRSSSEIYMLRLKRDLDRLVQTFS